MPKYTQFEVITPATIITPPDFMDEVIGIGAKIFNGNRSSKEAVRMWTTGELLIPTSNRLVTVDPDKLNYVHFSRVTENVGKVSLNYLLMAQRLDPELAQAVGTENGLDLMSEIRRELEEKSGQFSLEGLEHSFNYLDVVSSAKYPNLAVFVLRQEPLLSEEPAVEPNLLEVVTGIAQSYAIQASPQVFQLNRAKPQGLIDVEGSIPFARTKMADQSLIDEFRATFTDQMFDPSVTVRLGVTDIIRQF